MHSKDPILLMGSCSREDLVTTQSLELKDESQFCHLEQKANYLGARFNSFEYQMKTTDTGGYRLTSVLSRWMTEWYTGECC